jgi:hypothetical protein
MYFVANQPTRPPTDTQQALAYSSSPRIKVACYFETSVYFQRNTQCYFADDRILPGVSLFPLMPEQYIKIVHDCVLHCLSIH